jgi:DNA-binding CsgD family transcriptional regulator
MSEPAVRIVGRDVELADLDAALRRGFAGEAVTTLLSGESGVGKTALCTEALRRRLGPDTPRLQVRCLPLQALTAGLAPLRPAVQRSAAPAALIEHCLAGLDAGDPLRAMDDWVEAVTAGSPLLIFVDDVQWADDSLRDLLLYLVAGPIDRRLAVLVTARTAGLPEGHPMHGWLAELLRLPQVNRLEVEPLTPAGTEEQLAALLGAVPHRTLVDEVHTTTRGNPYLTMLLCRGLSATERHLPTAFPRDLLAAVTGVWHRCTPATRTVTGLLAVAGDPRTAAALREVAGTVDPGLDVSGALAEAETLGLLEQTDDGRFWFRHPLQAEVLERSLTAAQRHDWHIASARADEATATALQQALRYDRAGDPVRAYRWAITAWNQRDPSSTATTELRRVLRRAVALHPQVPDAAEDTAELWRRLRSLGDAAGAFLEELEAVDALITLTDPIRRPLELSELLVRRMLLRMVSATGFCSVTDMERAVELASASPDSWQYALALAELAHAAYWGNDPRSAALAPRALAAARASRHPTALSLAMTAASMVALDAGTPRQAEKLAAEAADIALAARDWWPAVHAIMWQSNALPCRFEPAEVDHYTRRRRQLAELGAPPPMHLQVTVIEADVRLGLGDAAGCAELLRESLVCDPGPIADVRSRLTLARLATYLGRVDQAVAHVDRARELIRGPLRLPNLALDATWATVLLEADRPREAYQVAIAAATSPGVAVDMAELLVPLAARALADQLAQLPAATTARSALLADLDSLREEFPHVIAQDATDDPGWQRYLQALQSWYEAETARAHRQDDEAARWATTAELFAVAHRPWQQAYAEWRAAEAFLAHGHSGRADGTRWLKSGYALATRLGAERIRRELAELGRLAHVSVVAAAAEVADDDPLVAELTSREREIVGLLCGGLTYAEIAQTLVISEKTVSSHVSNILRKTGSTSRVELTRRMTHLGPEGSTTRI